MYNPNPFDADAMSSEHNETGLDVPPEMFDYGDSSSGEVNDDDGEGGSQHQQQSGGGSGELRRNKIIAGAARSKVSRSSESSLGLSSSNRLTLTACFHYTMILANCAMVPLFIRL